MAALAPAPKFYEHDSNGDPLASGLVYTYENNSVTPLATYTDAAAGTANANPVVLDAAGRADIWLKTDALYTFVVKTSAGATVYTVNDISAAANFTSFAASSGAALIGFIQAGSGAVATTLQTKGRQVVSAFDYMTAAMIADVIANTAAVDVTAAIQSAATYSSVYFPAGTYKVTAQISVPANRTLYGLGGNSIIAFSGSMAANSVFTCDTVNNVTIRDLSVTGIQTNDAGSDLYGAAVYADTCVNLRVQNLTVSAFPQSGIFLRDCTKFEVTNCNVQNVVPPTASTSGIGGISVVGASEDGLVAENYIKTIGKADGATGIGIRIIIDGASVPAKIRTIGNHVEDTAIHGIIFYNSSGVVDAGGSVIADNIVKRTGLTTDAAIGLGNGIYATGVGGLQITGNSVYSSCTNTVAGSIVEGAIVVSNGTATPSVEMTVIANNVIDTALIDGISVLAARVSITGNAMKAVTGKGIIVQGDPSTRSTGCAITGNVINATTSNGIYVESFDDVTISGNNGYAIGTSGISVNDVDRFAITGNTMYGDNGATDTGIIVQEAAGTSGDGSIIGNVAQNFGIGLGVYSLTDGSITGNTFGYSVSGTVQQDCVNVDTSNNNFSGANTLKVLSTGSAMTTSSFTFNRAIDRNTFETPYIDSTQAGMRTVTYGGAVPNQGAWQVGDTVWMRTPVSGGPPGWMCTTAGSPGTWKAMANLA